jgi:hypothetical protein
VAVLIVAAFNLAAYCINERSLTWRLVCGRGSCCCRRRAPAAHPAHPHGSGDGCRKVDSGGCGGLLAISNRAPGVPRAARPSSFWCFDLISPSDLTSCALVPAGGAWAAAGALVLAGLRTISVLVFIFAVAYDQTVYPGPAAEFFKFFTNWTFVFYGAVSLAGVALSLLRYRREGGCGGARRQSGLPAAVVSGGLPTAGLGSDVERGWTGAEKAYLLAMETVAAASCTLTIFYWASLWLTKVGGKDGLHMQLPA